MRFREFVKENTPTGSASGTGTPPGSTPGKEGQDIAKLTATIQSLQKQVTDLQKASLQQSTELKKKPGEGGQTQAPKGTTGTGTQPGQAQAGQANPMMDMLKKMLGTQQGGTAQTQPAQKAPMGQSSQVTDMKIRQQLAKTQGQGT